MAPDQDPDWIAAALAAAARTERAPQRLRQQIDALAEPRARRPRVPRWGLIPAAGLAAVILGLIFVLPGGAPGGPTVAQAAASVTRGGWLSYPGGSIGLGRPTPSPKPTAGYAGFANVTLPADLAGHGTWIYSGERTETLKGHRIEELIYLHNKQLLVYSIAATPLLRDQRSGFSSFRVDGHTVVSWQESGHSCILVSATASRATLLRLAQS